MTDETDPIGLSDFIFISLLSGVFSFVTYLLVFAERTVLILATT